MLAGGALQQRFLKPFHLVSQQVADSKFSQVHLGNFQANGAGNFPCRPTYNHAQVIGLIMLWMDQAFDSRQSRLQQLRLPFLLPNGRQFQADWVRHPFYRCCPGLG